MEPDFLLHTHRFCYQTNNSKAITDNRDKAEHHWDNEALSFTNFCLSKTKK